MNNNHIPLLDIHSTQVELENEMVSIFRRTLQSGRFVGGPKVEEFEQAFARYCDSRFCVGVSSGTDALRFALIAAGIERGDRVITVPNTFIATCEAITQSNAVPVFVDIDERTYNISVPGFRSWLETRCVRDPQTGNTLEKASGHPVTAVIPVHLYGQMAEMDPILELAAEYHLMVIEDACQAHGAEYFSNKQDRWCKAGSMGTAAAFSFYPGNNLGALGEGGAVTTQDIRINETVRILRDHGQSRKYFHDMEGYNGRLDALQAEILWVKLSKLNEWNAKRAKIANRYNFLLKEIPGITVPFTPEWSKPVHHFYVIRAQDRDSLKQALFTRGIETGLHYPLPLHLQNAYEKMGLSLGSFPVAEKAAKEILSLPMYPALTESQQNRVVDGISDFYLEASKVPGPSKTAEASLSDTCISTP